MVEREKYEKIRAQVREMFLAARQEAKPVRIWELHLWIAEAVQKFKPKKQCTSHSFIDSLKKDLKISSRRVTRFVTKKKLVDEPAIMEKAAHFVQQNNAFCDENCIPPENVWNSDQSGFNYEMTCDRTYEIMGTKHVLSLVVDKNSTTHSYTLQVHLSKAGKLGSKFYLCFQEDKGIFGPRVHESVVGECSRVGNIVVVEASTSGKLQKKHVESWKEKCFRPDTIGKGLSNLLLDAWGTHRSVTNQQSTPNVEQNGKDLFKEYSQTGLIGSLRNVWG